MPTMLIMLALTATPPPAPLVKEAPAVEAVKPLEVKGRVGRAVRLTAPDGKAVRWELGTEAEADLISDGSGTAFVAAAPGRYLLLAYSAVGDVPGVAARVVVVLESGPNTPPVPVPPIPVPIPPGPVVPPVPPKPADPLAGKLHAAFAANAAPLAEKTESLKTLAELYAQAGPKAKDPAVRTTGELVAELKRLSVVLTAETLPECRKLIAAELFAAFPADVALTDESRTQAAALFARIAACLKEAAK